MQETETWMPHHDIADLLKHVEEEKLGRRLGYIYSQVPTFDCETCNDCCFGCAQVYPIEFVNIYSYLLTMPELTQSRLAKKLIEYEILHLTTLKLKCPFLEEQGCAIKPVKPLLCRLYGLYSEEEYKQMSEKSREDNEKLAMYYARHHRILLPEEVMTFDVPYCRSNDNKKSATGLITFHDRQRLYQQIYSLSEQVLPDEWLSADLQRFSFQYALFYLSEEEIDEIKLKAIPEFQTRGSSASLDKLMAKHGFRF